jgi:hypothetical protein
VGLLRRSRVALRVAASGAVGQRVVFTGRLHGLTVEFERSLKELDVELINSTAYHPQTLGKLERFHRTLKEWLTDEGPACDLAHLQELLDGFRFHYNRVRPHQAIGNLTPADRYQPPAPLATGRAMSVGFDQHGEPIYPPNATVRAVSSGGKLTFANKQIQVGRRWAGCRVRVVASDGHVHLYWGEEHIRSLTLDPTSRYQGASVR